MTSNRVVRGGGWYNDAWYCRSAYRGVSDPSDRDGFVGFRVAADVSEPTHALRLLPQADDDLLAMALAWIQAPCDPLVQLSVADWLEEHDLTPQSELTRLTAELLKFWEDPNPIKERTEINQAIARILASGVRPFQPSIVNQWGMCFVLIPPGVYQAGVGRNSQPVQKVVRKPFWLGETAVTQKEYEAIMGSNPAHHAKESNADELPVESVSWNDAVAFCKKAMENDQMKYILPTEWQWEWACRAGTTTAFHFGDKEDSKLFNCWKGKDESKICAVRSFPPNAFGLYEMHGNVWEWCENSYETKIEPDLITEEDARILRGGSVVPT